MMSKVIENYYKQANVMPLLLKQKMNKLSRNEDVLKEFEYWIEHKAYLQNGVCIEGYTAKEIAAIVGSPQGTVSSKLFRAFKKMRKHLEGGKQS